MIGGTPAFASTYITATRTGFLSPKLINQTWTSVGSVSGDTGDLISALSGLNMGVAQNSSGYPYGFNGYGSGSIYSFEFLIEDASGNVLYDDPISGTSNSNNPYFVAKVPNLSFNPTSQLNFYVKGYSYFVGGIGNVYYSYYEITQNGSGSYEDTWDTFNSTTITEGDAVALQTQQYAQSASTNAQTAATDANNANTAAQAAQTAAQNAANGTNTIINSYLSTAGGVIQDSSGTVLTASRAAQLAANTADTDIKNAQSALSTQLSNVQTSVTNITNYLPPTLNKVSGYNGATATSATSFKVTLDYNNATDYQYQIDGGAWSAWNSLSGYSGYVTVSGLSTSGMHTITVKVRNGSGGPTAQGSMNVFKL